MNLWKNYIKYGLIALTILALLWLHFGSAKALTPQALIDYQVKADQEESLRLAYEEAKTERCRAEIVLSSAKLTDYFLGLRELEGEEDQHSLADKVRFGCDVDTRYNFTATVDGGLEAFLQKNAHADLKDKAELFTNVAEDGNIKPATVVCIATADSNLGQNMRTKFNPGNVGNTATASKSFDSWEAGIQAIVDTLNNQYLGDKQTIGSLSAGGGGTGKLYATSPYNWNKNTVGCLRDIYNDPTIDESFKFRL